MSKSRVSTAVALALTLAAPAALAQGAQPMTERSTTAPAALSIQPDQMRASKLIGSSVYDVQNQDIGSVKDIVVDHDGKVSAVIVDVGSFLGMGGKYVAVALDDIKTDNDRLTLNRTKDQLKSAQTYELQQPAARNEYGSTGPKPANNKAGQ